MTAPFLTTTAPLAPGTSVKDAVSGLTGSVIQQTQSADWDLTEVALVLVQFSGAKVLAILRCSE
jgi:hypothetical protein